MITSTSDLVKRAMAAADMHDSPVTPAQWMYWGTQENLSLSIFLARAGWVQNVKTTTITVTGAEAGVFNLTVNPLAIVAVHQVGTDSRVRRLKCNNAVDFLRQLPSSSTTNGDPREFRVLWDQDNDRYSLNFYPAPLTGTQFLVSYIPHPLQLTLDDPVSDPTTQANAVTYPLGFEERVVLGMAKRAVAREESDTTEMARQISECQGYIEEAVWDRVFAAASVRNVDKDERGWTANLLYPPSTEWWFV